MLHVLVLAYLYVKAISIPEGSGDSVLPMCSISANQWLCAPPPPPKLPPITLQHNLTCKYVMPYTYWLACLSIFWLKPEFFIRSISL